MLLSDGGLLSYQAFVSPLGLRFARVGIDWLSHADGRGPRGASNRIVRFDGLGESKKYRSVLCINALPTHTVQVTRLSQPLA